jgi:hypothetical protein
MFISKGKERAFSLTGNTIAAVIISPIQAKNTYLRVKILDTFIGDRKKFKTYEIQCRIYL